MRPVKILIAVMTLGVVSAFAQPTPQQTDLYARINPLEQSVANGTATPAQQIDLARLYIRAGRLYEAQRLANQVLRADPDNADAKAVRDQATSTLNAQLASRVTSAEAQARSGNAQDRLALANAYFDAGRYSDASDLYAKLPASSLDQDAQLRYARSLAWSNRLDDAERAYAQLVAASPSDPNLELEYGRVLSWMGASRAAITKLTDVYGRTGSEDAVVALANAKSWSGDPIGASRLLDEYVQAHPTAMQAAQLREQLKGSPDTRLQQVNSMIALQPYNLALQVARAHLLYDAGRYAEAIKTAQFVKAHSRQKIEGLDELIASAEQKRKAELAKLEDRRHALEAQGSSMASSAGADEMLSLAKAYTGLEDYDNATNLYDRYLKIRPDDTTARIQYARVLSWNREWRASEAQYETLLNRYPDRADLRLEYGQVLSYDSNYKDALHVFNSVTDLSANPRASLYSDVPTRAYYNIGQIYRWYGWNDHDVAAQNQAIAMDSAYDDARNELDLVRHLRPSSTVEGRYTYATDSDNFTLRRYDLNAEKWVSSRTAYDLGVGRHDFELLGDTVSANVFNAGARYRTSDRVTLRGNVGMNFYDHGVGTRPFFGVGGEFLPNLQSRAALDFNHYDLVYDVFTLQSLTTPVIGSPSLDINSPISINDVRGHYDYNSGGFWSALADASYGFISDSNRRAALHGIAAFRVLKAPFVALKADAHYLNYDFRSNRYWSPPSYHSFAGVVQVGQNVRDRFFWNVELKAGKAYESGFTSDIRAYEGNVTVPLNDRFDLVGDYGYGKSGRLNSIVAFNGSSNDFVNYWQRHWFLGFRVKQLFGHGERGANDSYYYDTRALSGAASPVIPPLGETH